MQTKRIKKERCLFCSKFVAKIGVFFCIESASLMDGTDHIALNEKPTYFDIEIEVRQTVSPKLFSLAKHVNYL